MTKKLDPYGPKRLMTQCEKNEVIENCVGLRSGRCCAVIRPSTGRDRTAIGDTTVER